MASISKFTQDTVTVEYFPSNRKSSKIFTIKETSLVKFFYPIVLVVKGCNEIFLYNASEDLYYYMKSNSPILFESSTHVFMYSPALYCYIDSGDHIHHASFSFNVGINASITACYSKIYLEKSHFPDQKLLAGYDLQKVKYATLEEDSYLLLFSESIVSFGSATQGLMQVVEEDYLAEEVINIQNYGLIFWTKGQKSIEYKEYPINLVDV